MEDARKSEGALSSFECDVDEKKRGETWQRAAHTTAQEALQLLKTVGGAKTAWIELSGPRNRTLRLVSPIGYKECQTFGRYFSIHPVM